MLEARIVEKSALNFYRVWLPQSGYVHAHIADVELYDRRFDCESPTSEMEYWISIAPKGS